MAKYSPRKWVYYGQIYPSQTDIFGLQFGPQITPKRCHLDSHVLRFWMPDVAVPKQKLETFELQNN